jgi:hypothetical protein
VASFEGDLEGIQGDFPAGYPAFTALPLGREAASARSAILGPYRHDNDGAAARLPLSWPGYRRPTSSGHRQFLSWRLWRDAAATDASHHDVVMLPFVA